MNIQTDRYNWSVSVPLHLGYGIGLVVAACVLLVAAIYCSGVSRAALTVNPIRLLAAVVGAAAHRGEGLFWAVWGLIGVAAVLAFTSLIIFVGLVTQ